MSFYEFRFEEFQAIHKRGNVLDDDLITFTILINQVDRGHGSGLFVSVYTNSFHSTDDFSFLTSVYAHPAGHTLNMGEDWTAGPFEIAPADDIIIIYTGVNTSDSSLANSPAQERLELDILNQVAKKGIGLVAGVGLGVELGELFSDAFNELIADPVGDLLDWHANGPCNGLVFSDAVRFSGRELDDLAMGPLTHTLNPRTSYAQTANYGCPGIRFTKRYTDAASHNTDICGHVAETDVTFSLFRLPYVSVKNLMGRRFPDYHSSLRSVRPPGSAFSLKRVLGVLPD
jgi:hypothetical protein